MIANERSGAPNIDSDLFSPLPDAEVGKAELAELIRSGNLTYHKPVHRTEAGLPLGNGRMGSLVWTAPHALKMQINRCDVFACGCDSRSFSIRHTDYASGCAYFDLNLAEYGEDVFVPPAFEQHLDIFRGELVSRGKGVTVRALAVQDADVFALEVDDRRVDAAATVDLRMLRYTVQFLDDNAALAREHKVRVETKHHRATSQLHARGDAILLTQEFVEGDFYCASAVAVRIADRDAIARIYNETTVRLSIMPGKGRYVVLVSSAASFDRNADVCREALAPLTRRPQLLYDRLSAECRAWWVDYWKKSTVHLHSADGEADYLMRHYHYYLYLMACSSRGAYPPRYGGMLWYTNGDMRAWGAQYWWQNNSCYHMGLIPANRPELMQPFFNLYLNPMDSLELAARQQWDTKGVWIPETMWFDGLENLPAEIAAEMCDLYLMRKPWSEASLEFRRYTDSKHPHNARWNTNAGGDWVEGHFVRFDKPNAPFGHVTHIFSNACKLAYLLWQYYQTTQDAEFLRKNTYRVLRGAVEFYRNFPNVRRGPDGIYHLYHANLGECHRDVSDPIEDIAGLRWCLPVLIKAAKMLDLDGDLVDTWQEFYDALAQMPTRDGEPQARRPGRESGAAANGATDNFWTGYRDAVYVTAESDGDGVRPNISPFFNYDYVSCCMRVLGGEESRRRLQLADNTYRACYPNGFDNERTVFMLWRDTTAAAHIGATDAYRKMIINLVVWHSETDHFDICARESVGEDVILPNLMTLREGPGAIGAQRLGRMTEALHEGLLQSASPELTDEPVIMVFPCWPADWDASYRHLAARGGFLVSATRRQGWVTEVTIRARTDNTCRLVNPWPGRRVHYASTSGSGGALEGSLLTLHMQRDEECCFSVDE